MTSTKRGFITAWLLLIGSLGLVYAIIVAQQLIAGVRFALSAFALGAFVYYAGSDRRTLTHVTIAVTVVYGLFTFQLPLAIIAACAVYLSAWLTGPDSPFDAPDTEIFPARTTESEPTD